ncbi:AraC family transcriptional regulator [Nonomuraea sp. NPDC046802]|uniref:AraC family transcriptional regulator n=1 Tax=Nonomuraea sp. NPDC046802 TaxID=3154919 RepID=UPI0033CAE7ED
MEALAKLLRAVRAEGTVLRQSFLAPPWSLLNEEAPPLTLYTVLRGSTWVVPEEGHAALLTAGDTALLRGPAPHRVADDPNRPPQVVIHHGVRCTHLGARPSSAGDPLELVTGAYRSTDDVGRRLISVLPALIMVRAEPNTAVGNMLAEELTVRETGQDLVLDRLLDLLLVRTLRSWFLQPDTESPAWYLALGDPVVGPALRAMHAEPARPWNIGLLAATAGVSRASFTRRFTALVKEPPMTYLAGWRMTLAADLLREPGAKVASVARRVGYTNGFAFSSAFKRFHGTSPSLLRHRGPAR